MLRMLLVIIVIFSHLSLTNGGSVSCETDVTEDNEAAEGDSITHTCSVTHSGSRNASLVWYDQQGQQLTLAMNPAKGRLSITYTSVAHVPKISTLICVLCEWMHGPDRERCILTNNTCHTKDYDILFYVRSIATWPVLYASPGELLTCSAKGNPDPEYLWVRKEDGGEWVRAYGNDNDEDNEDKDNDKVTAELSENSTSAIYKCIARNTIRGQVRFIDSAEIEVIVGGAKKRWIIIGVVLGVIAVIAIVGGIVYFVFLK